MIICWWSGGVTSAVACKIAIDIYGADNCKVILIDTGNEHEDTYRFKDDCANWYGLPIETISAIGDTYESIQAVWEKHQSLNVANGAVCSYMLKRRVREKWEKETDYRHQVFGFEFDKKEFNRANSLRLNHPNAKPIFPLLMLGLDKDDCIRILRDAGLVIPAAYLMGFKNNNCLKTGCIQGGIMYWKKIQAEFPDKFEAMAKIEHDLTEAKGKPVTMLKDQSNKAKQSGVQLVFLKPHPDYPEHKTIDQMDMKGRKLEPLAECSGFCGVNDLLKPSATHLEINYEEV